MTSLLKISKAAIRYNNVNYTGWRHSDIIFHMRKDLKLPTGSVSPDNQGFLTDNDVFLSRADAEIVARNAGQIDKIIGGVLTSEDLWDNFGNPIMKVTSQPVPKKLKMHIVLRWDLSSAGAVVAAAHSSLGTYLTFKDNYLMQEWEKTSFVKIIHRALHKEQWEECKKLGQHRVFTESALGNLEVALGFNITEKPSLFFKDIPLWIPNPQE